METKKKRLSKGKAAILLSACAATALCANLTNSCSADEDYNKYKGDELQTHAAATRSVSEEQGTVFYAGDYVQAGHTFYFTRSTNLGWNFEIMLQWSTGYTGNTLKPFSKLELTSCSPVNGSKRNVEELVNGQYINYVQTYISSSATWDIGGIKITINYVNYPQDCGTNKESISFTLNDIAEFVSYDELPDSTNINN